PWQLRGDQRARLHHDRIFRLLRDTPARVGADNDARTAARIGRAVRGIDHGVRELVGPRRSSSRDALGYDGAGAVVAGLLSARRHAIGSAHRVVAGGGGAHSRWLSLPA